jgi:dehydrogenase/reductase SDR family member 12
MPDSPARCREASSPDDSAAHAEALVSTWSLLDELLDRTVLAGYTRVGYNIRRRSWQQADLQSVSGKTVLVTGATSGIGLAAAQRLASMGASIWVAARERRRGEEARAQILAHSPGSEVYVAVCDLGSQQSVRDLARSFTKQADKLDVLINNAAVLTSKRCLSADGIELTFATNVLGPFLLTSQLAAILQSSSPARVINVSSGGAYTQRLHLQDLQMTHPPFDGAKAYARSKRALVILSEMWAQRLKENGVAVHAMHPGWVNTPGLASSLPRFHKITRPLLRTPAQGADTIVWLAAAPAPALATGQFWHDRSRRPTHIVSSTKETQQERELLWAECERLTKPAD